MHGRARVNSSVAIQWQTDTKAERLERHFPTRSTVSANTDRNKNNRMTRNYLLKKNEYTGIVDDHYSRFRIFSSASIIIIIIHTASCTKCFCFIGDTHTHTWKKTWRWRGRGEEESEETNSQIYIMGTNRTRDKYYESSCFRIDASLAHWNNNINNVENNTKKNEKKTQDDVGQYSNQK